MRGFDLVILGPQGSGKGTQAELLVKELGYVLIGAGETLREMAKRDTPEGREVKATIEAGHLVDPMLISRAIKEKIQKVPLGMPVIIDGYPRSLVQYEWFRKEWPALERGDFRVLFIGLSEDEAVRRLGTRLTCERCGEIYIAGQAEKCLKCGGRLQEREDDQPEAVRRRLQLFNAETMPVVERMEKDGKVIRVDGAPSIEEVHREILEKLGLDSRLRGNDNL